MPEFAPVTHTRRYSADLALVLEHEADGALYAEHEYAPNPVPTKGPF